MATMSAARIRSLYRRHNHAYEAVYHFFREPGTPCRHRVLPDPRYRNLAIPFRRRTLPRCSSARDGESGTRLIRSCATSQFNSQETTPMQKTLLIGYLGKDPRVAQPLPPSPSPAPNVGRTVPASRRNTPSGSTSRSSANAPRSSPNTSTKAAGSSSKAGNGPNRGMTSSPAARST